MGAEQKTHFQIDKSKCIKCGRCINTCSGMVIEFGPDCDRLAGSASRHDGKSDLQCF